MTLPTVESISDAAARILAAQQANTDKARAAAEQADAARKAAEQQAPR